MFGPECQFVIDFILQIIACFDIINQCEGLRENSIGYFRGRSFDNTTIYVLLPEKKNNTIYCSIPY